MAIGPTRPPTIYQQDSAFSSGFAPHTPADFAWRHEHGESISWPGFVKPHPTPLNLVNGKIEIYIGALAAPDIITVSFFYCVRRASRFPGKSDRFDLKTGDLDSKIQKAGRRRQVTFTAPRWQGQIMRLTISYSNNGRRKPSVARYLFRLSS